MTASVAEVCWWVEDHLQPNVSHESVDAIVSKICDLHFLASAVSENKVGHFFRQLCDLYPYAQTHPKHHRRFTDYWSFLEAFTTTRSQISDVFGAAFCEPKGSSVFKDAVALDPHWSGARKNILWGHRVRLPCTQDTLSQEAPHIVVPDCSSSQTLRHVHPPNSVSRFLITENVQDRCVEVRDASTGCCVIRQALPPDVQTCLPATDGTVLLTTTLSECLYLWDVFTGVTLRIFELDRTEQALFKCRPSYEVRNMCIVHLLEGEQDLSLWSSISGEHFLAPKLALRNKLVRAAAIDAAHGLVLLSNHTGQIEGYDIFSGQFRAQFGDDSVRADSSPAVSLMVDPGGRGFVAFYPRAMKLQLCVLETTPFESIRVRATVDCAARYVAECFFGKHGYIFCRTSEGLYCWNTLENEFVLLTPRETSIYSYDAGTILSLSESLLHVWRIPSDGRCSPGNLGFGSSCPVGTSDMCCSPDGSSVAFAACDAIHVWNSNFSQRTRRIPLPSRPRRVHFDPIGELVCFSHTGVCYRCTSSEPIELCNVDTTNLRLCVLGRDALAVARISPATVSVHHLGTGASHSLKVHPPHLSFPTCMCFSPDGKRLYVSFHSTIRGRPRQSKIQCLDVASGQVVFSSVVRATVTHLCVSTDNSMIAVRSSGVPRAIRIYSLEQKVDPDTSKPTYDLCETWAHTDGFEVRDGKSLPFCFSPNNYYLICGQILDLRRKKAIPAFTLFQTGDPDWKYWSLEHSRLIAVCNTHLCIWDLPSEFCAI
eukprot:Rmarinus@m.26435